MLEETYCQTVLRMAHDPGKKALELLRAERLLQDRELLDRFGKSVLLREDPHLTLPHLESVAEGIVEHLPQDLRPVQVASEDNTSSWVGSDDLTVLQLTPYRGPDGRAWIGAVSFSAIPWQFSEEELDTQRAANLLNMKHLGSSFVNMGNKKVSLAVVSETAVPSDMVNGEWLRLVALLHANVYETNHRMLDPEASDSSYIELEEVAAVERGEVYMIEEVVEAVRLYKNSLPTGLRELVRYRFDGVTVRLFIPFHTKNGTKMMSVGMFCLPPQSTESGSVGAGLHIYSNFPDNLTESEVRAWCDEANGGGADERVEDEYRYTTPWKLGNWKWFEEPGGSTSLIYSGHIPNRLYSIVDLDAVVAGVVREIWSAWDRYRLREEFGGMISGAALL